MVRQPAKQESYKIHKIFLLIIIHCLKLPEINIYKLFYKCWMRPFLCFDFRISDFLHQFFLITKMRLCIILKFCQKSHNFIIFIMKKFCMYNIISVPDNIKKMLMLLIDKLNSCYIFVCKCKCVINISFWCHLSNHHVAAQDVAVKPSGKIKQQLIKRICCCLRWRFI